MNGHVESCVTISISIIDQVIVVVYLAATILIGFWVSRYAAKNLDSYFLGGKALPWYMLGISNASGMFDITGTMWLVYLCFVYGLKSIWIPWVWPTFNQIFLMVYLAAWLRRSNVLTGAQWMETRFGRGTGANLAHLSVVLFALINVIGFIAYAFRGIGKFAAVFLPFNLDISLQSLHQSMSFVPATVSGENVYALIILSVTALYVVKGGMYSVVLTEVLQFTIMTIASIAVGIVAMSRVSPEMINAVVPAGWNDIFFGWHLSLDWTAPLDMVNKSIQSDGFSFFTIILMLMVFKGVLASMAGPAPNYDMQRILATRNAREASLMSATVNVALYFPRYMMVAGLTILAIGPLRSALIADPSKVDFEQLLPLVIRDILPIGLTGLLLAGLLAAFMSTFAATVNAGPAYIVNDLYKRFINPQASDRTQVRMSYAASVLVVIVGMLFGLLTESITQVTMWIVGALYGGYVAANVLKWHWWRFNGYGYFWGMIAGTVGAMGVPKAWDYFFPGANTLYAFPAILLLSVVGCLLGTLLTQPEDDEVLLEFYRNVRPWGFWGPVREAAMKDPEFEPNREFRHNAVNVVVGVVWQLTLTVLPIYIVIRQWGWAAGTLVLLIVTTIILKFNWYDRLETTALPQEQGST